MMDKKALSAREAALRVLVDIEKNKAYSNISLKRVLNAHTVTPEDRRLATELVYGTLEWQLRIDWILARYLRTPVGAAEVTVILRMAVYQILWLDRVPDSAAVDEAVKLTRNSGFDRMTGFVNSVLRKVATQRIFDDEPDRRVSATAFLSVRYSMPEWIVRMWSQQLGEEQAEALLGAPSQNLVSIYSNSDDNMLEEELKKRGLTYEKGRVFPRAFLVRHLGDVAADPWFIEGKYSVLGEASAWAASLVQHRDGMRILDACAAPGGKTLFLAGQAKCEIHAWDLHRHRVGLMQAAIHRTGITGITTATKDAAELPKPEEKPYDAVIIDAPCSGLGTVAHRPELKYRLTRRDITDLVDTQKRLLTACARRVAVGGVLVYATCTINKEENQDIISAFLKDWPEFRADMPDELLPPGVAPERVENGGLLLLPHLDGCDGFFGARLVRRA
ncbi:MAG: 16S rRNA (cytosine(967)-C(5))-methyltransferase RsmB [Clostridia bacterium]|nr:16S rRNA (cytosine(967)-C(5))-methyltransferase RsmB [Clostridia bacterium]